MGMVTFSLCMIVKNEEKVLRRCLDSVKAVIDEFVIVDTGSTDGTKAIIKEFTDKEYHFDWVHDFAAARNYAFEQCTMDYVLTMDADEYIDAENLERLKLLKEAMLPEIDIVQMLYTNQLSFSTIYNYDTEYRPKLFKRVRGFVWEHPIHETVRLEPVIYDSEVEIQHLPEESHTERDLAVFRRMIKSGEPLDDKMNHLYARELYISGTDQDVVIAGPYFKRLIDTDAVSGDLFLEALCVAARASRLEKDNIALMKYALKAIVTEGCSEICCELGDFFIEVQDYIEAKIWFYNAVYETESVLNLKYHDTYPLDRMKYIEPFLQDE